MYVPPEDAGDPQSSHSPSETSAEVKFDIQFMMVLLRDAELTWAMKSRGIKHVHLGNNFCVLY